MPSERLIDDVRQQLQVTVARDRGIDESRAEQIREDRVGRPSGYSVPRAEPHGGVPPERAQSASEDALRVGKRLEPVLPRHGNQRDARSVGGA
jgi:hypothetical protein